MANFFKKNKIIKSLFFLLIFFGIFFRFYNLDWGSPYYFHPDERNIASGVTRIHFPEKFNPEFFAYGSLPIYSTYFLGVLENSILKIHDPSIDVFSIRFESAILLLRLISASLSVGIIILVFKLINKNLGLQFATLGTLLATFNVGLLQYSHFGTFEIWLSFLFLLLFYLLSDFINKPTTLKIVLLGIITGLLVSVKISSIIVLPILVLGLMWSLFRKKRDLKILKNYFNLCLLLTLCINIAILVVIFTSPYFILDFESFRSSMNYESAVALGSLRVFYTGGFLDTIPILYQIKYVFPFILNPLNLLLFFFIIPFLIRNIIKHDKFTTLSLVFFCIIFFSQAFFYVKWVRYYIPTLPFLIILITIGIKELFEKVNIKKSTTIFKLVIYTIILFAIIHSISYIKTVLIEKDSRVEAYNFSEKNILDNPNIVSEVYDMGIVPFNNKYTNIKLFDFYALDSEWESSLKSQELETLISESDYFMVPSQRVERNRILKPNHFPKGHTFYTSLAKEDFHLIYETPCDIFCRILYMGNPIYSVEETANVFDRPIFKIYKINE